MSSSTVNFVEASHPMRVLSYLFQNQDGFLLYFHENDKLTIIIRLKTTRGNKSCKTDQQRPQINVEHSFCQELLCLNISWPSFTNSSVVGWGVPIAMGTSGKAQFFSPQDCSSQTSAVVLGVNLIVVIHGYESIFEGDFWCTSKVYQCIIICQKESQR